LFSRSVSSLRHSSIAGVIFAAEPASTPYRVAGRRTLPRARLVTIPAAMLLPAPMLLTIGTVGDFKRWVASRVTSNAPADPRETTTTCAFPSSTSGFATNSNSVSIFSCPTNCFSSFLQN